MKRYIIILLLALVAGQILCGQEAPSSACQNFQSGSWTVSTTGLNNARELRVGTGTAYVMGKNKIRVNLVENSPLGIEGTAVVIEFNNECFGRTDSGDDVYLNLQRRSGVGILLWLGSEVRKAELIAN